MRILKISFILLVSFLIVAFALLNASSIQINYLLGHFQLPLSLALLLFLSLGALIGMLWTASWVITQRYHVHELNKKVNLLQKEIDNLRAMPVKDVNQWS
jgi:putative membrane protein